MARIIDENFEGTGYEETWAETVTAGNTLDEDAAIPGTPPTGSGSQCLKAIFAVATSAFAEQTKTNQNISYVRYYLYVETEGLADGHIISLVNLRTTTGTAICAVQVGQNAGVLQARYNYYSSGAYQTTAWVNINIAQWYRLEFKYDLTNMLWEWKIDGVSQTSGSLAAATYTPGRMRIGGTQTTVTGTTTLYQELVVWDDTNWVGEESAGISGGSLIAGGRGSLIAGGLII